MRHQFFILFLALLSVSSAQAQNYTACTTPTPLVALRFDKRANQRAENLLANPYVVQVFIHILRDDDGTNAAMDDATLKINLDRMAGFYRPHNICFTLVGRDFIDNSTWNTSFTGSQIGALHAVNPHTDAIDMYIHKNGFDSSGGNAYSIPSTKCSVAANASFNFEHEMGHCLGLLHTFETANGTECPDGTDCGTTGDLICDTPADFSGSQGFRTGCTFTGTQTINCSGSDFSYNPPTQNIMSYFAACYNNFTAGQRARMQNTIDATTFLQDRLTPDNRIIAGVTLSGEVAIGAQDDILIGNIAFLGDVAMNGNAHGMFNAGSSVQVLNGTVISPTGTNTILLTTNTLCDGLFMRSSFPTEDRTLTTASSVDKMVAFPNPFTDKISIRVNLAKAASATLQLFDFAGRLVQSIDCQPLSASATLSTELSLPELAPGMYFLRLDGPSGVQTVKLVKI